MGGPWEGIPREDSGGCRSPTKRNAANWLLGRRSLLLLRSFFFFKFIRPGILAIGSRQVVNTRVRAQFLEQPEASALFGDLGELDGFPLTICNCILIFVAKINGSHGALLGAGRQSSRAQLVRAEDALLDDTFAMGIVIFHRIGLGKLCRRVGRFAPVEG